MASKTYTAVGNREDLSDIITNISPDETPLMKKFGRSKVTGMTHAWLTDSLVAPSDNAVLEDASFTTADASPRVKLENNIQIFMKGCHVTDSQEAVLKAGIKSELAYQMQKTLKQIALDVEYAIVNNATKTAGGVSTAGKMGGIPYFNVANVKPIVDANLDFTEDEFNDAIELAWADGGTPDMVVVSGANKRKISKFTSNATRQQNAEATKIKQVVDVNIIGIAC